MDCIIFFNSSFIIMPIYLNCATKASKKTPDEQNQLLQAQGL